MDDLISRQAAIEVIDAAFPVDPMKSEYTQGLACGVALAKTYVEQLPSAQPERKKGRWEPNPEFDKEAGHGYFVCSACGSEWYDINGYRFCPNCGAKMEGEQE